MNKSLFALLALLPCAVIAAQELPVNFMNAQIALPPLSLLESARYAHAEAAVPGTIQKSVAPLAPTSRLKPLADAFIVRPKPGVDYKLTIKAPDQSIDYKLIVKSSEKDAGK